MGDDLSNHQRVQAIRSVIDSFLDERLQTKLEKIKADDIDSQEKERAKFHRETWIADAARRVSQIQMVTHALKFIHPEACGTNLFFRPSSHRREINVGTHCLPLPKPDIVGDAKVLDVNKFLSLTVEGKSLLDLAVNKDSDFIAAMSNDEQTATEWASDFAAFIGGKSDLRSSTLARQVYFPVDGAGYHLLAPLYPTSLAHHIFERINHDRFAEKNKAAREAKKKNQWHPHGFREYPNLATQKYGGGNPQNISQLNSERRGESLLMPSLPPVWQTPSVKPPLHADSVFPRIFGYRREVRKNTDALRAFLEKVQDYNNMKVRRTRAEIVNQIIDSLVQYAARVQELEPGWSLHPDCQLSEEEQLWLDPGRADSDPDFSQKYIRGEWRTAVAERFARWLNRRIEGKRTPMGDPEFLEWRQEVEEWL